MGQHFENQRVGGSGFHNCGMAEMLCGKVNLSNARFLNVNLSGEARKGDR